MAGEIQLNSTTMVTESSGSITAELDTIRPNTTNGSLKLQGDSSDAGVTGLTIDSSGNATFAGTGNNIGTVIAGTLGSSVNIKASINASGSAPIYACRAWVNFNGTGTVAINASGNVSSITDLGGNGAYQINFTTAMPDANYCAVASASTDGVTYNGFAQTLASNSGACSITVLSGATGYDPLQVDLAIFR